MARPRSRRGPALPLAILSLALMLLPSSLSQKPRLWLALAHLPFRWSADRLAAAAGRLLPASHADEDLVRLDQYKSKIEELAARDRDQRTQIERLSGTREAVREPELVLLPAHVIVGSDANPWRRSMVLARGSSHGVAAGMLVLWERHLVGRVVETTPLTCRIVLATDSSFRVGAVALAPLHDESAPLETRDLGVLEGTGGRTAVLKWIQGDGRVAEGATVVTSPDPETGVPRGLLLGKVTQVDDGRGLFPRIIVTPYLNYRALDTVVIVVGRRP